MKNSIQYLIVKGCAGLGNRLATVLSAVEYAQRNNRTVVIDWSDGQMDRKGVEAFSKCFELINCATTSIEEITNWQELSHSSALFKANKFAGVYDLYREINGSKHFLNRFRFFRLFCRRWQPVKGGGLFNSLPFGSDLSDNQTKQVVYFIDFLPNSDLNDLKDFVRPKAHVFKLVDEFAASNNLSNAVGVHVRSTDKQPTTALEKVINKIKRDHGGLAVFLCTDSTSVEARFKAEFEKLILYPKLKPSLKGEGLHQWALYNNADDLKERIYKESVIEMFLLSRCKLLFYQGNSTFSRISAVYQPQLAQAFDWLRL